MKKKVLSKFIDEIDWVYVEKNFQNIEKVFSDFLNKKNFSVTQLEKVDMCCNINDDSLVFF